MQIKIKDYNGAGQVVENFHQNEWSDIQSVIANMPLHLKSSDQRGKQGAPIFDAVGTNQYFLNNLTGLGWKPKIALPSAFNFLGTDIDFGKNGVVLEVQFSNYPFLLNNTMRSELFFKAGVVFDVKPTSLVIIVTKVGAFPASNSTLYYEQAESQLDSFMQHNVFSVPIRLVGLDESPGVVNSTFTTYQDPRYSRTVVSQVIQPVNIAQGGRTKYKIT